ncbi:MAG: EamA family transporter RarD [Propionibacteriales bacterium]|nr:EamA family transporter RarD [Propionibacteriales bacterium]
MTADRSGPSVAPEGQSAGLVYGLMAYLSWGLVPLFWPLVKPAGAVEILAHRILWSLLFAVIGLVVLRRLGRLPANALAPVRQGRTFAILAVAAVAIAVNWGLYIWAVNNGHVIEASLGYYINPIISIALGVLVLRERLRHLQWAAVGFAVVAVIVLTITLGQPPWISLALATSFGLYGLLKNRVRIGALASLVVESALLAPLALGYLVVLGTRGQLTLLTGGPGHVALLVTSGLVTLLPLIWFSAAAARLPLSMVGLLQYVTPTMQFLLGYLWFGELMPAGRWLGFALVWIALVLLTIDVLRRLRARRLVQI